MNLIFPVRQKQYLEEKQQEIFPNQGLLKEQYLKPQATYQLGSVSKQQCLYFLDKYLRGHQHDLHHYLSRTDWILLEPQLP